MFSRLGYHPYLGYFHYLRGSLKRGQLTHEQGSNLLRYKRELRQDLVLTLTLGTDCQMIILF